MGIQTENMFFEIVQLLHLYQDSKTFPDTLLKQDEETLYYKSQAILEKYGDILSRDSLGALRPLNNAVSLSHQVHHLYLLRVELHALLEEGFTHEDMEIPIPPKSQSMEEHIERMWDWLKREPTEQTGRGSSLIPLKHPYIVPGGRFSECYYWDSYFNCVGLLEAGKIELMVNIIDNMTDMIETFGYVPNGNRTYYASRSQPPFYCQMLQLLVQAKGIDAIRPYYNTLLKEYEFWQRTGEHGIDMGNDTRLSRYWDPLHTPRPESYREDVELAFIASLDGGWNREASTVYQCIRAGAESGWDFSSRWIVKNTLSETKWPLHRTRTTSVFPVDLNSLLYDIEIHLALWTEDDTLKRRFQAAAQQRQGFIQQAPFWNQEKGWFFDAAFEQDENLQCNIDLAESTGVESLAGMYPLFCKVATKEQAAQAAAFLEAHFLKDGGVVTTTEAFHSGQQWDYPNGWAPLQWITVVGLYNYGYKDLATLIAQRFVNQARHIFDATGKMMEKYDVCDITRIGGGGEYPNQDGFGWTNGIVKAFLQFLETGQLRTSM